MDCGGEKKVAIRAETELYLPIKTFLERQKYEVRGEVRHCDLVAVRGEEAPVVVELKRTFNLPLIVQGIDRMKLSDRVYLAVEMPATGRAVHGLSWSDLTRICRMLGLGLMTVRFYKRKAPAVEVLCEPAPYTPRHSKKAASLLLYEFRERSGDYNVGGSTRSKLVTAYREKALQCAAALKEHGELSTKRLRELTGNARAAGLMQKNYYRWFQRVRKGVYTLTTHGEEALQTFSRVIQQ
jgi:hypothetical protein